MGLIWYHYRRVTKCNFTYLCNWKLLYRFFSFNLFPLTKLTLTYHHLMVTLFGARIILVAVFPLDYLYNHILQPKWNTMIASMSRSFVENQQKFLDTCMYVWLYPSLETCILNGNEISSLLHLEKPEYICRCIKRTQAYKTIIH